MAAGTLVLAMLLCATMGSASATARPHARILRGVTAFSPDYLDPQLSFSPQGWRAMYDTYIPLLTYRHADGTAGSEVVPGLATSLPEITDGGRTYTLFLRRGLRYSDGSRVRAADFKWAIERVFLLHSSGAPFYTDIVGAKQFRDSGHGAISGIVTDDRTGRIVIHLVEPDATISAELALPFAAPVPRSTPAKDQSWHPPPSTGPYALQSLPSLSWVLVRNREWKANAARIEPRLPGGHLAGAVFLTVPNANVRAKLIERGIADLDADLFASPLVARLRHKYAGTRFEKEPSLNTYFFWMNTTRPPFNDVRVRQAVNYAIDPRH